MSMNWVLKVVICAMVLVAGFTGRIAWENAVAGPEPLAAVRAAQAQADLDCADFATQAEAQAEFDALILRTPTASTRTLTASPARRTREVAPPTTAAPLTTRSSDQATAIIATTATSWSRAAPWPLPYSPCREAAVPLSIPSHAAGIVTCPDRRAGRFTIGGPHRKSCRSLRGVGGG